MTSILTIGNSFANNATGFLADLCAAAPCPPLLLGRANLGGCSLEKHWNLVCQCDLLPQVRPYTFQITGQPDRPATLRQALASHPWDYVTLQQSSILSWRPETYRPWLELLHDLIRDLAPQATPVIFQTWAYRSDAPLYREAGIDQTAMYTRLADAYAAAAADLDCPLIPVGLAWQLARAALPYRLDPAYDFANPRPLQLPDQRNSLVTGYSWATGNTTTGHAELVLDPKHGNALGCYLANAVWYEMFTGNPIAANSFSPPGIEAAQLAILKAAAHEAVARHGGALVAPAGGTPDVPRPGRSPAAAG